MRAAFYSAVRRLETWSITLRPEQLGLIEGLRSATAVSLMVAVSLALDMPVLGWAAFGAFWTCLADPGGSGPERFPTMLRFTAMGAAAAAVMSFAGGQGYWISAIVLFAVVLMCGIARLSQRITNQVGVLATVVAVVAVDFPRDGAQALILGGIFATGSLFAVLLCAVWRIHPYASARHAVGAVYRELAFYAGETRTGAEFDQPRLRGAVRDAIERARGVLDRTVAGRNDRFARVWLQSAVDNADKIFAGLVALDHDREPRENEMVAALQDALTEIEDQVLVPVPDWSRLRPVRDLLAEMARRDDGIEGRTARQWAEALGGFTEGASPQIRSAPVAASAPGSRDIKPVLRHALRVAVTVAAVRATTSALHLPFGYWATVAVVVVMQPEMAATFPRMLERIVGSSVGGIAAALIYTVLPSPDLLLIAIFPIAAITIALRTVNYSLFVACLTALFVLVTELLTPATGAAVVAEARVYDNLLGAVFAMLGTTFLWPDPHLDPFRAAMEAAITANLAFAEEVLQGTPGDDARRNAGIASTAAELSLRRLLLQGRGRKIGSEAAKTLLAELRRLTGMATASALAGNRALTETIETQEKRCRDLADKWRGAASVQQ